ncbi:hypothetical protein LTR66_016689 [Elasticomyces elasticus]|nr:hypothetical protein LTR66_016689 [Elasticomyces elasticus]
MRNYLKATVLMALLSMSNAYKVCSCDAGGDGVSQNGFSQILNGLNQNSNDKFCVNAPDYDGCYTKKLSNHGTGNFYGCGIFCSGDNDSGACVYTAAYTAYMGANTGGCISKSDLISVVGQMAQDSEKYGTSNSITSEMSGGGFVVSVSNGIYLGEMQCDAGSCIDA